MVENNNQNNNNKKNSKSTMIDDDFDTKPKKKRRIGRLGFAGWSMVFLGAIIICGIASLLYLIWSFQVASGNKAAANEGLVPVSGDFAPGQTKKSDVLFRLAGNKRNGDKLFPDMAAAWMRARQFSGVNISKSNEIITISGNKSGKTYKILIALGSAKGGFEAMTQGRIEGVISARPIETGEADRLSAFGDMQSQASEKIIGHDVSFVLVNGSNPIENMNGETLGRILSGEITDWSEISDKKEGEISIKIEDLGADKNDGVLTKLLGDREIVETAKTHSNPEDVAGAVARDGNAIGFTHKPSSFVGVKNVALNERNAQTFEADEFNIATEAFPFTERIYLYIGSSNADANLMDFADFTLSPLGQEVVKRNGFGAQQLQSYSIKAPVGAPPEYANYASIARRMNFDFRFNQGANELDSKGHADLIRFRNFIQKEAIDSKRIALFGFADNVGARITNIGLGQSRAETIASKLGELGINPSVIRSFGDAMAVGANAYEAGRIKNRRVEVWVCPPPACPLMNVVIDTQASQAPNGTFNIFSPPVANMAILSLPLASIFGFSLQITCSALHISLYRS
ncbi:MAG: OmpA family protein, partial [Caulobacterales bacterium]|nr:OmpA family protein [Caulobacterales bacterium]